MTRHRMLIITFCLGLAALLIFLKLMVSYYENNLLFFPTREWSAPPSAAEIPFEDLTLTAADGVKLSAWWFPSDTSGRVVLVLHGNGGNISDRLILAQGLARQGFAVLMLDYRGYGKSEGKPSGEGIFLDAEVAWAECMKRGYAAESIVLYGESLGGAVAARLMEKHPDCRALVLDGTFTSAKEMSKQVMPLIPVGWLMTLDMDTRRRLATVPVPVLIFHGEQDPVIPFFMGEENYRAAAGRKRFVPVKGGQHCDLPLVLGRTYFTTIKEFVEGE